MLSGLLLATHFTLGSPAIAVGVTGSVFVDTGDAQRPLRRFDAVPESGTVVTREQSTAQLRFESGSIVRLGPKTSIKLKRIQGGKKPAARRRESVKLFAGRIWASVTSLFGDDSSFEVETDNAVAGVRGTSFFAETAGASDLFALEEGVLNLRRNGVTVTLATPGAFIETAAFGFGNMGQLSADELTSLRRRAGGAVSAAVVRLAGTTRMRPRAPVVIGRQAREQARQDIVAPGNLVDTPLAQPTVAQPPIPRPAEVTVRLTRP